MEEETTAREALSETASEAVSVPASLPANIPAGKRSKVRAALVTACCALGAVGLSLGLGLWAMLAYAAPDETDTTGPVVLTLTDEAGATDISGTLSDEQLAELSAEMGAEGHFQVLDDGTVIVSMGDVTLRPAEAEPLMVEAQPEPGDISSDAAVAIASAHLKDNQLLSTDELAGARIETRFNIIDSELRAWAVYFYAPEGAAVEIYAYYDIDAKTGDIIRAVSPAQMAGYQG